MLLTLINTYLIYLGGGTPAFSFTMAYLKAMAFGGGFLILLFLINMFVTLSYSAKRALHKKNLLKVSYIFLIIFFIYGLIFRIKEIMVGVIIYSHWINTILVWILIVIVYKMLKDLHKLINQLFNK